jgi:ABC-type uncharacterized transport system substrate-binding protein
MVHAASPVAGPCATGLSRRLLLRSAAAFGLSAVGLAAFSGCGLIPAQPAHARIPRIGTLAPAPGTEQWDPFRAGLREAGWIEGETITIEWRSAEGDFDRLPALAAELVALPVDLIVTMSSPATLAARNATSAIPIVFSGNGDPVASGFVQSLAHPGGNVTGTTQVSTALAGKRLSVLKELLPGLARVTFMEDLATASPGNSQVVEIQAAALQLGIEVNIADVRVEGHLSRHSPRRRSGGRTRCRWAARTTNWINRSSNWLRASGCPRCTNAALK